MNRTCTSLGALLARWFLALVPVLLSVACGGVVEDPEGQSSQEAIGTLSITGTIVDQHRVPVAGLAVALVGSAVRTTTTGSNGSFAFTRLAPGSYLVRPIKPGCTFQPPVVVLPNMRSNKVANFVASGPHCGGTA